MAHTVALSEEAIKRLRAHKAESDSYSDVVVRFVPPRESLEDVVASFKDELPMGEVIENVRRNRQEDDRVARRRTKELERELSR